MPRNTLSVFNSFKFQINSLESIRRKIENLYSKGLLVKRDVEQIYSSAFIDAIVYFEAYIEKLFIGLLSKQLFSNIHRVIPKIDVRNSVLAREVVLHTRSFYDWLPYNRTERISKVFFKDGRPFTVLTQSEKNDLDKCLIIRNALAHKSNYAITKFQSEIISSLIVNPRDRKPKSFLRKQFSIGTNYYQEYVLKILRIANRLY